MPIGRSALLAIIAGLFLWVAGGLVTGDQAVVAQGCGSCAPPTPPPRPPAPPCNSCGSPPPCNTCGGGGHIKVPNINVYVAPSVIVNARASANIDNSININAQNSAEATARASAGAYAGAMGNAGATGYGIGMGGGCCGGGGQQFYSPPMSTGFVQGMVLEGRAPQVRRVAYEAMRTRTRRVVIQAYCLDDKDVPHPASQVTPDREIDDFYDGELYRCIAGTRMQYVVADYGGKIAFDGGQTIVCAKNESLWHSPRGRDGGGRDAGAISCRNQKPARDCNERSLLRRFGAGVKILTMISTEKYTAYREETVIEASSQQVITTMSLDGGVGGVAF